MTADGSTIFSLFAFCVTDRLSFEMTATTENFAPSGFQHLVQPHAWLNATLPFRATVTGFDVQRHVSVPPAKSFLPGLMPLSMDGWSDTAMMKIPSSIGKNVLRPFFRYRACVYGGKKPGFCRLPQRVATPGPAILFAAPLSKSLPSGSTHP